MADAPAVIFGVVNGVGDEFDAAGCALAGRILKLFVCCEFVAEGSQQYRRFGGYSCRNESEHEDPRKVHQ